MRPLPSLYVNYGLIAVDLDRTLTGIKHEVSGASTATMRQARGVKIVVCICLGLRTCRYTILRN